MYLLALDALFQTGKKTGKVNVAEFVAKMRQNRVLMVQTYVSCTIIQFHFYCIKKIILWYNFIFLILEYIGYIIHHDLLLSFFITIAYHKSSFLLQEQYITIYLALNEVFKAPVKLDTMVEFLNKTEKARKNTQVNQNPLHDEFQVWSRYLTITKETDILRKRNIRFIWKLCGRYMMLWK